MTPVEVRSKLVDALGLGVSDSERLAALDFLIYRRENLVTILNNHRPEFRAIAQWSLLS